MGFKGVLKAPHLGPDKAQSIVNPVGQHTRGLIDVARGLGCVESEVGFVKQEFVQPNPGGSASGKPSNTNPDLNRVFATLRDGIGCCSRVNAMGVSVEDTPLHEGVVDGRPVGMSPSYPAQSHQIDVMTEGQSRDKGVTRSDVMQWLRRRKVAGLMWLISWPWWSEQRYPVAGKLGWMLGRRMMHR